MHYFKRLQKPISLLLALVFIFPSLAWAFKTLPADLQPIAIPKTLGGISTSYTGGFKRVVLIKDLHCHEEVQSHIARIIELLSEEHGLQLVGVEGASRSVNVSKLSTFPVPAVRELAGKWLLQAGLIGGPEYLAATSSRPIRLLGIECEALYQESLAAVHAFLTNESLGCVADMRDYLETCREKAAVTGKLADVEECARRIGIIERMLSVSATAEDIADFESRPGQYSGREIMHCLRNLGADGHDSLDPAVLDHYLGQARAFYRMADERSQCFVDNLDRAMARQGQNLAVMVAGGYHAQGIEQALQERGFSYLVITPRMSHTDQKNHYWQLLQNRQTRLDRLLEQNRNLIALPFNTVQVDESRQTQIIGENNLRELKLDLRTEQQIIRFFHLVQLLMNAGLLSWLAARSEWASLVEKYFEVKKDYPADFSGLEIAPVDREQIRRLREGRTAVIPLAHKKITLVMCRQGALSFLRDQALSAMNFGNGYDMLVMTNEVVAARRADLEHAGPDTAVWMPALRLPQSSRALLAMTALAIPVQMGTALVAAARFVNSAFGQLPDMLAQPQLLRARLLDVGRRALAPRLAASVSSGVRLQAPADIRKGTGEEEAAARAYLERNSVEVETLQRLFPEVLEAWGWVSFRRLYEADAFTAGKAFGSCLPLMARAYTAEQWVRFWPDIVRQARHHGEFRLHELLDGLAILPAWFTAGEIDDYWPLLVEYSMKMKSNFAAVCKTGLHHVRPLIVDPRSFRMVMEGLVRLAEVYGENADVLFPSLGRIPDNLGPGSGLEKWPAIVEHLTRLHQEMYTYEDMQLPAQMLGSLDLAAGKKADWEQLFALFHRVTLKDPKQAVMRMAGVLQGLEAGAVDPALSDETLGRLEDFMGHTYGFCLPLYRIYHRPEFAPVREFAAGILEDRIGLSDMQNMEKYLSDLLGARPAQNALVGAVQTVIPGYRGGMDTAGARLRLKAFWRVGDVRWHIPPALRDRVFGRCVLDVNGEKHEFEFRVVKGLPYALWGLNSNLCYSGNPRLWECRHFMLVAMIDKTAGQVSGFMNLLQEHLDGQPRLMVPGLEPNGQLLQKTDHKAVVTAMENALLEIAEAGDYEGLYLTADQSIISHHRIVREAVKARHESRRRNLQQSYRNRPHPINLTFSGHYPFYKVYALWERGAPLGEAGTAPAAASVLDPVARRYLNREWLGYKLYTTIGAPIWETFLFQGLGYGYGQAQSSFWLQAAGGLWMTAAFAFAHTIVEWIVRAREVGWRRALGREYLKSDAGDFGARLLVSGLFSLPFFLLPASPFLAAGIAMAAHGLYNWAVLEGRLPGPLASIAERKNYYLARKGTVQEEEAAKKYLLDQGVLSLVEDNLPGVVQDYGYTCFRWLHQQVGPANVYVVFKIGLPELAKAYSRDDLAYYWPDILRLAWVSEKWPDDLFLKALPGLPELFTPDELRAYWDTLVEEALQTGEGCGDFLALGLKAVRLMIVDQASLKIVTRNLVRLAQKYSSMIHAIYPHLEKIPEVWGREEGLRQWPAMVTELELLYQLGSAQNAVTVMLPKMILDSLELVTARGLNWKHWLHLVNGWMRKDARQATYLQIPGLIQGLAAGDIDPSLDAQTLQKLESFRRETYGFCAPLFRLYQDPSKFSEVREFAGKILTDRVGLQDMQNLKNYLERQQAPKPMTAVTAAVQMAIPGFPDRGSEYWDAERLNILGLSGDLRQHVPEALRGRAFGECVMDVDGKKHHIEFRVVKGIPFTLWGVNAGLCYSSDRRLWGYQGFFLAAMIDKTDGRVAGFMNLVDLELEGASRLLVPGLEPNRQFLRKTDPEAVLQAMEKALFEITAAGKYAGLYLTANPEIASHRRKMRAAIDNAYHNLKLDLTYFFAKNPLPAELSFENHKPFQHMYVLWERGRPLGRTLSGMRKNASILDPLVRRRLANETLGYKWYTVMVAPFWETPLFQGLGYWLFTLGKTQSNVLFQCAGGLWMTAAFAFAHTIVEWIVRAREVGWRGALGREYLKSDAEDFGARLLVSGLFSLPFFLLPASPFLAAGIAMAAHGLYNWAVLEGWLHGPLASIRAPELQKGTRAQEEEAKAFLSNYFDLDHLQRRLGKVFERYGYVHLAELVESWNEYDRRTLATALLGNFTAPRPAASGARIITPGRPEAKRGVIHTLKTRGAGIFTETEALEYWPGIMHMAFRSGPQVCRLFQTGLRDMKTAFPDETTFRKFWPGLVSLGAEAGEAMTPLFRALNDYALLVGVRNTSDLHKIGRGLLKLCRIPGGDLDLRFYAADLFKHHLCGQSLKHWDRMLSDLAGFTARTDIYARIRIFNTLGTHYSRLLEDGRVDVWDVLSLMKEVAAMDARLGPLLFANIGLALESDGFASDSKSLKIKEVLARFRQSGPATLTPLFQYYLKTGNRGYAAVRYFGDLVLADQVGRRELDDLRETIHASNTIFESEAAVAETVHTVLPGTYTLATSQELLQERYLAGDLRKHIPLHVKNPVLGTYWIPAFDGSMSEIEFRVVKGIPYGNWGLSTGLCFYQDLKLWTDENFLLLAMIDKTHGQVAGFVHLYFEKNRQGEKVLLLPGLEPISDVLAHLRPKPLLDAIKTSLVHLCTQEDYAGAYIPRTGHLISHDEEFARLIGQYFEPDKIADMSALLGRDTSVRREKEGFLRYYTFTEGWAVWEKGGRAGAFNPDDRANPGIGLHLDINRFSLSAVLIRLILQVVGNTFAGPLVKALALRLDPGACVLALLQSGRYPDELRNLFLETDHTPKSWLQNSDARSILPNAVSELTCWMAANPTMAEYALGLLNDLASLSHIRVGTIWGRPLRLPRALWKRGQEHSLGRILDNLRNIPNLDLDEKVFERKLPLRQRIGRQAA